MLQFDYFTFRKRYKVQQELEILLSVCLNHQSISSSNHGFHLSFFFLMHYEICAIHHQPKPGNFEYSENSLILFLLNLFVIPSFQQNSL